MRYIYTCLIFAVALIISSCSNKQYQALFESRDNMADSLAQKTPDSLKYYRIQPQDILQIKNLQNLKYITDDAPVNATTSSNNTSQGQEYQVEEDGTVALPVIGHVQISGFTRAEAQKTVEQEYRKKLLNNPIIELKIVNLKVTILGEIKSQGNFQLVKDKTTLIELIGEAGGLTEKANEKNVKIIRGSGINPQVTIVNLNNIASINDPRTILQSGDIIYVAQNKRAARNDNLQNFSIFIQPALILFNTALIIFTLARN